MNLTIWKRIFSSRYGLALGINILLQGTLMAAMFTLLPILVSEEIGLDKSEVMVFFLINTITGIVVTLGTGWLSDGTVARYKLVIVSGVIGTLGLVGVSQATLPIHAYLAGVAIAPLGVMFPQLFAVAKAGVVAGWEHEAQVMGITSLRTLFSLGFVFGTAIASILANHSIRMGFFGIGVAALVLSVIGTRLLFQMESYITQEAIREAESPDENAAHRSNRKQLPLYALILPLVALTLLRGADSTRGVYLSLVMFQSFQDASIAPLMFGITTAFELITIGMMGYLSSKIGEKITISIGALVGAAYFGVMALSQSLPLLYVSQAVYAIFIAAFVGVAMAYVQGLVANRAGLGGSLYMAVFNVGSLIGILLPLLVHAYDPGIFIAPIILCVGGAALLMLGDRTAQIEKQQRAAAGDAKQPILVAK